MKYDVSVSFISVGFHGGGLCLFSSAFQSNPSKNGCTLMSSESPAPDPSLSRGSLMRRREIRFDAFGEKRFYE